MDAKEMEEAARTERRWRNRRRMAWLSFVAVIAIVGLAFVFPDAADKASAIVGTCVVILGSIILGYLGFSTMDDKWNRASNQGGRDVRDYR